MADLEAEDLEFENLPLRANLFDASALVKVFSNEHGAGRIRSFFLLHSPAKYTTAFCLYEALNALKSKWVHRRQMSQDEYTDACSKLVAWYRSSTGYGRDLDLTDPVTYTSVVDRAAKYAMDLSDSLQVESLKSGYFSRMTAESTTVLVTADHRLAEITREEGLRAWHFPTERVPR